MRTSQDKTLQGLAGQMAPNQLTGSGGQPGKTGNDVWKVPHTDPQNYQVPQPPPASAQPPGRTAFQLATQGPLASTQQQWRYATPVTFGKGEPDQHVEGNISAEANGQFREGSIEGEAGVSFPRSMYTGPADYIVRGTPPPTKKRSGKPLQTIDKRVAPVYQNPEDYPRK